MPRGGPRCNDDRHVPRRIIAAMTFDTPVARFLLLLGLGFFFGLAFEEFYASAKQTRPGGVRTFPMLALVGALLYRLEPARLLPLSVGLLVLGAVRDEMPLRTSDGSVVAGFQFDPGDGSPVTAIKGRAVEHVYPAGQFTARAILKRSQSEATVAVRALTARERLQWGWRQTPAWLQWLFVAGMGLAIVAVALLATDTGFAPDAK